MPGMVTIQAIKLILWDRKNPIVMGYMI